jgi:hypothetical protein
LSTPRKAAQKAAKRVVDDIEFQPYPNPTEKAVPPVPQPTPVASAPPPPTGDHPPSKGYDQLAEILSDDEGPPDG